MARSAKSPASRKTPSSLDGLTFHPVDTSRWKDFERFFETPGAPKYCWCMAWRTHGTEARDFSSADRKAAMRSRVKDGVPVGILGYLDGEPVAWCSIAPRPTYRNNLGGPTVDGEKPERVWSLACFFVPRALRGQGMTPRLITAAVAHARKHGATVVEAYPVDAESPSYRFMGFVPVFTSAGFEEVGRAGSRRHVMRLSLR
ncbi:GNAT family N-acetyltransferase [Corallococcus macrosporus]|uniref:GNAT family N-acetyltransferase n=1 Tax=Corallococcus macrosporus TaxID=35 RepID=A0ABS3DKL5_9BACT|nr:GNAT family N-acetyltransferase [Corallococcus macrosporus]MBN8231845.1 GNAT family N-acetyltransferase [Corallococcus macrosporus]